MERLRALLLLGATLASIGCASVPRAAAPGVDRSAAVKASASADIAFARGCLLCLQKAAVGYEQAISLDPVDPVLRAKAVVARLVQAAREREIGMRPSDALARARQRADEAAALMSESDREFLHAAAQLIDALPLRAQASSKEEMEAAARRLREALIAVPEAGIEGQHKDDVRDRTPAWLEVVRRKGEEFGGTGARYLALSYECSTSRPLRGVDPSTGPRPEARDAALPLFRFRAEGLCGRGELSDTATKVLEDIVARDPEFYEAHLYLGLRALAERRVLSAEKEFLAGLEGLPQNVFGWSMLGSVRHLIEEYSEAAADFTRALSLEPDQREALLARAQALTYAGRFEEAARDAARLIEMGVWFQTDANYWLALNEYQLGRIADAQAHAQEAKRTNARHGDTARLVGLITERLGELDRAQTEFELAISRNDGDCEARQHLGTVHAKRERWTESVEHSLRARGCYDSMDRYLSAKGAEIRASALSALRKDAALGRLNTKRQMVAQSRAESTLSAAEGEVRRGALDRAETYLNEAAVVPSLAAPIAELRKFLDDRRARPGAQSDRR